MQHGIFLTESVSSADFLTLYSVCTSPMCNHMHQWQPHQSPFGHRKILHNTGILIGIGSTALALLQLLYLTQVTVTV